MKSPDCEYRYGTRKNAGRGMKCERKLRNAMPAVLMTVLALTGAALLILSLFARVELTEVNDKNVGLGRELDVLLEENRRLRIEYEFAQDLNELEKEAEDRLGMGSILQRRPEKIDTAPEDKACIIDNG